MNNGTGTFLSEWLSTIIWIGTGLLAFAIFLFFFSRYARNKAELMKESEGRAAERFEASMMKAFEKGKIEGSPEPKIAPFPATPESPLPVDSPPPAAVSPLPSGAAAPPVAGGKVARALGQLETAGLLERSDDRLVLTEDLPPAQLLVLKGGKRALIFPPYTPLEMIERHRKEADYLILFPGGGAPLLCRDISDYVADALFG